MKKNKHNISLQLMNVFIVTVITTWILNSSCLIRCNPVHMTFKQY